MLLVFFFTLSPKQTIIGGFMIVQKKQQLAEEKFRIAEENQRKFFLEGNLWKVILYVTFPIMLYLVFQTFFNAYDIVVVNRNQTQNLYSDNFLSSMNRVHIVKEILMPFGASIATAGVILVGRTFGRKNIEKMRLYLAQTFVVSIIIGVIVTFLYTVVFKNIILHQFVDLSKISDQKQQNELTNYYLIIIASLVCIIINIVFLALERAKGNNKMVLWTTLVNVVVKIILSLVFWHFGENITSLAWATLAAHAIITLFVFWFLFFNQNNHLKIILKKFRFDKAFLKNLFILATPVCASIMTCSIGRMVISMIIKNNYDNGAGIDAQLILVVTVNNIFLNIINAFADSQNAIISPNLGQNNMTRVFDTFKKILIAIFVLAIIGSLVNIFCYPTILSWLTGKDNLTTENSPESCTFKILLYFETTALFLTCTSIILFSFFTCFKKTKVSLSMNLVRIIVGIFFLLLFKEAHIFKMDDDATKVGLSLLLGNLFCLIATLALFIPFYCQLKKENIILED